MDYNIQDLIKWNEIIENKAIEFGLDFYPQEFEIIDYNEMLGYEAYIGMPSKYPHWSYGKAYDKNKTLYSLNLTGLPYEMVINSNPCLAYLMRENTLLMQILTMAHVYGHNDFFKNNRLFVEATKAKEVISMFKLDADIIKSYIDNPDIGYEKVERVLDAAHSIRYQIPRVAGFKEENSSEDLIGFLIKHSELEEWEKNILRIVKRETEYFIPQIETKVMNEGWASYWHYNILKELDLDTELYLEFIRRHNDVVAPTTGSLNPYYIGFKIFEDIEKRYGRAKIFEVRKLERDSSFYRRYLTQELCQELNLYKYGKKNFEYIVEEVADESGWQSIRDELSNTCGVASIPLIKIVEYNKVNKELKLEHVFDGRELELSYAKETMRYIQGLFKGKISLVTRTKENREVEIICDENNNIVIN
ncbi:SpoVR family protein [Clostridium isatidis]|uniref:Stage V sporulation protein R n=1 Tax=Clostridium isatidis TaxID=182773 RepID=A0A343JD13_9CLOT|nr:SpoVR family protein [Clostridium isatidis]ASW43421.1 stage V sporulation protein R [Clostridium isatidis]